MIMSNANRFCLALILTTLVCIIIGIFLVATSLHYTSPDDQETGPLPRRDIKAKDDAPPHQEPFPVFPEDYHASGLLILPHSSIAEPFEIWYSNTLAASRIDYYYGTDKTFQRGDEPMYGKFYKIVPMYNDKQGNFEGCWTVTGREKWPIFAQTIIPNITWFKYVKTEVYTGVLATKWHYEYWAFGLLNSQNVWVTKSKPHRPIRYEMKGYDSMLGSYYDHYVLEYVSFEQWRPQMKRFELPRDITCFNWSLTLESSLIANPMQEFTKFSAEHLVDTDGLFDDFKKTNDKNYDNESEHKKRKQIYKHNMRFIRSMNRKKKHFKLESNHFTDMSDEEFETHVGSMTKFDSRDHAGMKPLHKHDPVYVGSAPKPVDVPDELDWRDYGAVSSVKGQGICGSCYTFSAAGAAEGAHFLKTGKLVPISSQQILDCSWGSGNHGCKGGHYAAALSFLYLHGAATLESYGKYLAQEGVCHFNDTLLAAKIDAFAYVPSYNNSALKHAVAKFGPAAVSINVSPLSFKFYSHGVYHDADCWPNRTRHSALVVGYGKIKNGKEYWLVKNSWSDSWGERGYIRVAMDNNMCGITESPVVALVNHITFQFPVKEKITSIDSKDKASMGRKVKASWREEQGESVETGSDVKDSILSNIDNTANKILQKASTKEGLDEKPKANSRSKRKKPKKSKKKEGKKIADGENAKKELQMERNIENSLPLESVTDEGDEKKQEMDEKETPKIEKIDEKDGIDGLGEMVVNVSVSKRVEGLNIDGMKYEETRRDRNPEMVSVKSGSQEVMDDFKLPTFKGNVDQSKLPNAFSESAMVTDNGKALIGDDKVKVVSEKDRKTESFANSNSRKTSNEDNWKEEGPKEEEGGSNGGKVNGGGRSEGKDEKEKLISASEAGVDVTVEDTSGLNDIQVSVTKTGAIKNDRKKGKRKKTRTKQGKKSGKHEVKSKGNQKVDNGKSKMERLPVSKKKLRRVLKDTLKSLYKKIDTAMLKQIA